MHRLRQENGWAKGISSWKLPAPPAVDSKKWQPCRQARRRRVRLIDGQTKAFPCKYIVRVRIWISAGRRKGTKAARNRSKNSCRVGFAHQLFKICYTWHITRMTNMCLPFAVCRTRKPIRPAIIAGHYVYVSSPGDVRGDPTWHGQQKKDIQRPCRNLCVRAWLKNVDDDKKPRVIYY